MNFLSLILCTLATFLIACKSGSVSTHKKNTQQQEKLMPKDTTILFKQQAGVDLVASGSDPVNWKLEMDFDKHFIFTAEDGSDFIATASNPVLDSMAERYHTKVTTGNMTISIFKLNCTGSKKVHVDVTVSSKRYIGCAEYLYDYRLNDTWSLQQIDNEVQQASAYSKGLPTLSFNLGRNKVSGHNGCNTLTSGIIIKGTRIEFTNMTSTKMACSNTKTEKIFSTLLNNQPVRYYLSNEKLTLELIDDSRLVFTKSN